MYAYSIFWLLTFLHISIIQSHSRCDSFDDVLVGLKDNTGYVYNKTINGCIERTEFGNKTVVEAFIENQKIPKLRRDSVRNMKYLRVISFQKCDLEVVEPTSFRNVPGLKDVQISFCNLRNISKGTFSEMPELQILKIHHNKLNFMEPQVFANLTNLIKIYASHNYFDYWNIAWFDNSINLHTIDFRYNKIKTIPAFAFASFSKLKLINFDYNEIDAIQPEVFKGLTSLEYLGLKNNRLKEINANIFPNKLKIRTVLIGANYLNYLSTDLLQQISVTNIILDFNPWKCSCLNRIHYWIHSTNGTLNKKENCDYSNIPVCAVPKFSMETCTENIDNELTERYFNTLRNLPIKLSSGCARI